MGALAGAGEALKEGKGFGDAAQQSFLSGLTSATLGGGVGIDGSLGAGGVGIPPGIGGVGPPIG